MPGPIFLLCCFRMGPRLRRGDEQGSTTRRYSRRPRVFAQHHSIAALFSPSPLRMRGSILLLCCFRIGPRLRRGDEQGSTTRRYSRRPRVFAQHHSIAALFSPSPLRMRGSIFLLCCFRMGPRLRRGDEQGSTTRRYSRRPRVFAQHHSIAALFSPSPLRMRGSIFLLCCFRMGPRLRRGDEQGSMTRRYSRRPRVFAQHHSIAALFSPSPLRMRGSIFLLCRLRTGPPLRRGDERNTIQPHS